MKSIYWLVLALALSLFACHASLPACCCVYRTGSPVVNADQTVIILWDEARKTQHFIRKASFESLAADFGFIVPSPTQPELSESGNDAFPYLQKLTEPEHKIAHRNQIMGCGCAAEKGEVTRAKTQGKSAIQVLEEKQVAGFNATVLAASSAEALTSWLMERGYAFSPNVATWAKPYIDQGWKFTALKVAKDKVAASEKALKAAALRISFKTDRPLFPYREPDPTSDAQAVGAKKRLLRIYFLAETSYLGQMSGAAKWSGAVAWSDRLKAEQREKILNLLALPNSTGPADWWLTEFEDNWPYRAASSDVYFKVDPERMVVKREPIIEYVAAPWPTDITCYAVLAVVIAPPLVRRVRCRRRSLNG